MKKSGGDNMTEKTYFAFVLGYDLLHDMFANSPMPETDITFEFCNMIADEFLKSAEYKDMRYSAYDMLQTWLRDNADYITKKYNEFIS